MTIKPYAKTLQDELDWKLLDQLHGAVAQISNFCFEIKKFCVTTLFVAMTLIIKFTSDKLKSGVKQATDKANSFFNDSNNKLHESPKVQAYMDKSEENEKKVKNWLQTFGK